MYNRFEQYCKEILNDTKNLRRDFHKHAETGWLEFRTASIVARKLTELGFIVEVGKEVLDSESRMGVPDNDTFEKHWQRALEQGGDPEFLQHLKNGFTGVVGLLDISDGPITALRFDMDALEIMESDSQDHNPTLKGFASVNKGMMHACGHDSHTATGLGLAKLFSKFKDSFEGKIILIFQPAEEGVRGAKSMVDKGILDGVQYLIGHHVYPGWAVGEILPGLGGYAATEKFDVHFIGQPAHAGGKPEKGKNALLAAATATLNLYAIPRHSEGFTRINVGKLIAGSGRNVICPNAHLVIETRGETNEISGYMRNQAETIIKAAAQMHQCDYEIKNMGSAITGESDQDFAQKIIDLSAKLEIFSLASEDGHGGGSEDFTYMMEAVQKQGGKAVNIGIGADASGLNSKSNDRSKMLEPHTFNFDINEDAMFYALYLLSSVVYNINGKSKEDK